MDYYADTTHISNSMISAYLRSPSYFKALYIDKTLTRTVTPALIFGSAVDVFLTEGQGTFNKKYCRKFKRTCLKKDDPDTHLEESEILEYQEETFAPDNILTPAVYDHVVKTAKTVASTPAFQWFLDNNTQMQVTLTGEIDGVPAKGKPDFLTIIGDTAYVDDLKTAKSIVPRRYHYHCIEYGYYRQAKMYKELVLQKYPEVKRVVNRHIVVTKDSWPQVATFVLDANEVDAQLPVMLKAMHAIQAKQFKDPEVTWESAPVLGV